MSKTEYRHFGLTEKDYKFFSHLDQPVRGIAIACLRAEDYLDDVLCRLQEIDGFHRYADKVIDKVVAVQQLQKMRLAYQEAGVPKRYIEAVRYLINTYDKGKRKAEHIGQMGLDLALTYVYYEKVLYQYARLEGWPVPNEGKELFLGIDPEGNSIIVK